MARKSQSERRSSGDRPEMRDNLSPSAPPFGEEYKVGPGRPPKEHQWKPGQSGNPKDANAKMTEGDHERLITMWDAGMQQLAVQFAKGDRYARRDAFWIIDKLGPEFLKPKKAPDEALAADRQAILDAYVSRHIQGKSSSASSPALAPSELLDDDAPDEAGEK